MELAYLHNILDDLRCRFETKHLKNDFQLKRELIMLGSFEKLLIRKKVLGFNYNVGALKVLKTLKETGILTFPDYLSSINDSTVVQGIITDVIDVDEIDLFVDIIISSSNSDIMKVHFDECIKVYISDVIDRPELIKHELFNSVEKKLPGSSNHFRDCIVVKFVNELLTKEAQQSICDHSITLSAQKAWNDSFEKDSFKLLKKIIQQLSENHSEVIVKQFISAISKTSQLNWFFLLMMIKNLKKTIGVVDEIKNYLKSLFQRFHQTTSVDNIFIMMILSRQFFFYSEDFASYKNWVKLTIGEMHNSKTKSQLKFKQTLEFLQNLIFYETDVKILEVHLQTSISAPQGLNNLVLEYKQQLRVRIAALITPETCMDLT